VILVLSGSTVTVPKRGRSPVEPSFTHPYLWVHVHFSHGYNYALWDFPMISFGYFVSSHTKCDYVWSCGVLLRIIGGCWSILVQYDSVFLQIMWERQTGAVLGATIVIVYLLYIWICWFFFGMHLWHNEILACLVCVDVDGCVVQLSSRSLNNPSCGPIFLLAHRASLFYRPWKMTGKPCSIATFTLIWRKRNSMKIEDFKGLSAVFWNWKMGSKASYSSLKKGQK